MYAFWYSKESKIETRDLSFTIKQRVQIPKYSPVKNTDPKKPTNKQTNQPKTTYNENPKPQRFSWNTINPYTYKITFETNILISFAIHSYTNT